MIVARWPTAKGPLAGAPMVILAVRAPILTMPPSQKSGVTVAANATDCKPLLLFMLTSAPVQLASHVSIGVPTVQPFCPMCFSSMLQPVLLDRTDSACNCEAWPTMPRSLDRQPRSCVFGLAEILKPGSSPAPRTLLSSAQQPTIAICPFE